MIFFDCVNCNYPGLCYYEAAQSPCGYGVYQKIVCESCRAPNYVERISFGGVTLSEAEYLAAKDAPPKLIAELTPEQLTPEQSEALLEIITNSILYGDPRPDGVKPVGLILSSSP